MIKEFLFVALVYMGVFIFISFITGCQSTPQEVEISLPDPPTLKMRPVEWKVVTEGNDHYMCLKPEFYTNLSLNTSDIKAFIVYQNKVIRIYKYNN